MGRLTVTAKEQRSYFFFFFFFLVFLGPHLRHIEVPRLGAYATAHLNDGSLTC